MGEELSISGALTNGGIRGAETFAQIQTLPQEGSSPKTENPTSYFTSDIWTGELDGLWTDLETDTDVDIMTEGDFYSDVGEDSILDLDTEPLRYEDYLRRYLSGDSELSTPNADPATLQRAAPKTKEQIISELAPKIAKPGITPARAMMEAQRMYTKAEKIFGADTDIVLKMLQPDQNPRKFLDGFQNAYLSGKLGDKAALENSTAAAYLTEEQREAAYTLGGMAAPKVTAGTDDGPESISSTNPEGEKTDLLSILKDGTIEEKRTAFRKAFQEGQISTRISPQKQARHIFGTRQFQEYDAKLSARGDHPSYLRKDLSETDLKSLVIPKLQGNIRGDGKRFYEYIDCDQVIGFYYSKAGGRYLETNRAQVIYAIEGRNIHIFPVKKF